MNRFDITAQDARRAIVKDRQLAKGEVEEVLRPALEGHEVLLATGAKLVYVNRRWYVKSYAADDSDAWPYIIVRS